MARKLVGRKSRYSNEKEYERKIHTDNYDQVRKVFSDKLIFLINSSGRCPTAKKLSELLGINHKTIMNWTSGERLPRMEVLPLISEVFNVSIDELFGQSVKPSPLSYSYAFLSLESLGTMIERPSISDPFLRFMDEEYGTLKKQEYLPRHELDAWRNKLLNDFNLPVLPLDMTSRIQTALQIYSRVSRYDTYLACLRRMNLYKQHIDSITEPFEIWAIRDSGREKELLGSDGMPKDLALYPPEWLEPAPVPVDVGETEQESINTDTPPLMEFVPLTDEELAEREKNKPDNDAGTLPPGWSFTEENT